MIDIFELSFNAVMKCRNNSLNVVDDFFDKAEKIRKWIDKNPQKAKYILGKKKIKNRQQKYYYERSIK
ncbi:MAG: hypothetical protein M0R00_06235 [Candidatus Omnitrophica bacterium]|jgi:hypothetical protein|nr:hypothetical protein [Candidatus Omnitrophota bacterium]